MEFTALMVLMGLLGAACSWPACNLDCKEVTKKHCLPDFQHLPDLQNSSVAPWRLTFNTSGDREPHAIQHAVCSTCTEKNMIAKPIFIQISVYKRPSTEGNFWCKCPYKLAVGCTCVRQQKN